jgi:hypothetical protein
MVRTLHVHIFVHSFRDLVPIPTADRAAFLAIRIKLLGEILLCKLLPPTEGATLDQSFQFSSSFEDDVPKEAIIRFLQGYYHNQADNRILTLPKMKKCSSSSHRHTLQIPLNSQPKVFISSHGKIQVSNTLYHPLTPTSMEPPL